MICLKSSFYLPLQHVENNSHDTVYCLYTEQMTRFISVSVVAVHCCK